MSGLKSAHVHPCKQYGPLTSLLSTLCVLTGVLSRVHVKGEKGLNNFKLGTFSGRFPSYDAASMAMKGLNSGGGVK